MSHEDDVIRLQGYVREPALKKAVHDLRNLYGDNELVKEAVRCLAKREGLLPVEQPVKQEQEAIPA